MISVVDNDDKALTTPTTVLLPYPTTTKPEASKMMNQPVGVDDNTDDLLEEFFRDLDKLTISSDSDSSDEEGGGVAEQQETKKSIMNDSTTKAKNAPPPPPPTKRKLQTTKKKLLQQQIIKRAEASRQSWQEFSIPKTSTSSSNTNNDNDDDKSKQQNLNRPLVSFSLIAKKGKKKKSKSSTTSTATTTTTTTTSPTTDNNDAPVNTSFMCQQKPPHWIVVIDTCVLLEAFDHVSDLISTASVANSQLRDYAPSTSTSVCVEPITIVVPYIVWTELDFRSKNLEQDEDLNFRARRAIRLLNNELEHCHRQQLWQQQQLWRHQQHSNATTQNQEEAMMIDVVIRSQSRADMDTASREFLSSSITTGGAAVNNDDHILFCARAEQQQHLASRNNNNNQATTTTTTIAVGGVVLLTQDKVLTCKARADGVQVDTPHSFVNYYKRRAASLRDRTTTGASSGASSGGYYYYR